MARPVGHEPNLAREIAFLVLLAILWGSSYLFIKLALATIPPLTLIAMRAVIAALLLVLVVLHRRHQFPADSASWRQLIVQSLLTSTVAWILLVWGQQYVDSGLAGVLNSTSPIFVFFITLLWTRHEGVSWRRFSGAFLGIVGVMLIIGTDALEGLGQEVLAQLSILAGAAVYGAAAIYGRRLGHLPPTVTAASTMILASVCLVPLALIVDRPWTLSPSLESLSAALMLATFCTAGALLIYFRLIRTLGSLGVASQAYLRSGVSVLLGVVVLGEQPTWIIAMGLAAVIVGVAAINWPARRREQ